MYLYHIFREYDLGNAFDFSEENVPVKKSITVPANPVTAAWDSASYLLENDPEFTSCFVSKQEFQEEGVRIFEQKYKLVAPDSWYDCLTNPKIC